MTTSRFVAVLWDADAQETHYHTIDAPGTYAQAWDQVQAAADEYATANNLLLIDLTSPAIMVRVALELEHSAASVILPQPPKGAAT